MEIFNTSTPLVGAVAAGAVVTLTPAVYGTPNPLTVVGGAHLVVSNPNNLLYASTPLAKYVTLAGVIANDTVVINGRTFTCVASGATGNQFNVGGTDIVTATNLAASVIASFSTGAGLWYRHNDPELVAQISVSGTGTVSASSNIELSIDGVTVANTVACNASSGASPRAGFSGSLLGYPFVRANLVSIAGTAAIAKVLLAGINTKP